MEALKITPWDPEAPKQPVGAYLAQINEQRGFRDLTEQELEDDIARAENGDGDAVSEDEEEDSPAAERAALFKAKEQILKDSQEALNEVSMARDLVSMMLAGDSAVARTSISEMHKEIAPFGAISRELVDVPKAGISLGGEAKPAELEAARLETRRENITAAGLKFGALSSAADTLIAAAKRLEGEMERETRHWEDLLKVKTNGWIVSRISRDRKASAVRISSLESGPAFRSKGLVKIGRAEDGRAQLDLAEDLAEGKRMRVEIKSQGRIVAATRLESSTSNTTSEDTLHTDLKRAKDTLFDQELFHELSRESGALWNRGVKWMNEGVILPFESDADIVLSLVTPGDAADLPPAQTPKERYYQQIVDSLGPTLRILLSHGFRQIYNRRRAPPQPLTKIKSSHVHTILHPLLNRTQHQAMYTSMSGFLGGLCAVLQRAGFDASLETPRDDMGLQEAMQQSKTFGRPVVETIVDKLSHPTPSRYSLQIGEPSLHLRAMFRIAAVGTEYRYELSGVSENSVLFKAPQSMVLPNQAELAAAVVHLVQLRLVEHIHSKLRQDKWSLDSPHTGELHTIAAGPQESAQLIKIRLLKDRLQVDWKTADGDTAATSRTLVVTASDSANQDIMAELNEINLQS